MTTTQTDAIMALADRYAFHIPGSQHSDEARAVLLAALQEQAREGEAVAPLIKQITEAICAGQKQRSGESSKGTSQIPWTHTVGACAEVRNGANEHLQHRVGQTDADRSDNQLNSGCSGVSCGSEVCGQVAPQPAQPSDIGIPITQPEQGPST